MMTRWWRETAGFTWIEIVVLVALLGIVSALAVPRIQLMLERGREAATRRNIAAIKSAISIYYGDHEGVWPDTLDVHDRTPGYGFGNYLDQMPPVRVTHMDDPSKSPAGNQVTYKRFTEEPDLSRPLAYGKGWRYEKATGRVWVNSSYTDTRGVSYTTYGH